MLDAEGEGRRGAGGSVLGLTCWTLKVRGAEGRGGQYWG